MADVWLASIEYGGYLSWWKPLPFLLILLVWARLLTWVDKDTVHAHLPRETINASLLGGLLLGIVGFLLTPNFFAALGVFVLVFAIEAGVYLMIRSQKVGLADLKSEIAGRLSKIGGKKEDVVAAANEIVLIDPAGHHMTTPAAESPQRSGYDALTNMLSDPLKKDAQTVELITTNETTAVRYWVDGVPYDGSRVDRTAGASAFSLLKTMIGVNTGEVRRIQEGKLKLTLNGKKREMSATTAGSTAGERAKLEVDIPGRYQFRPEQVGFLQEQLDLLEAQKNTGGVVLLAAPKSNGLTALEYAMLRLHDAFIAHILTIERNPPVDLEGITQNKIAPGADANNEETRLAGWVTSQQPDVLLISGIETQAAARTAAEFASSGERRVYIGLRANDAVEAIQQWRKLVGSDSLAMKSLRLVVAGRLFRKLCDATKIAYAPLPDDLKRLGMSSRIEQLYKPHFGPLRDARGAEVPDTFCHGLGYRGRFGAYETLLVDDDVKAALAGNASSSQMRQLFRKQRQKYLQEVALLRVETGDTAVQEVLRVLKSPETEPPKKPASRPAPTAE